MFKSRAHVFLFILYLNLIPAQSNVSRESVENVVNTPIQLEKIALFEDRLNHVISTGENVSNEFVSNWLNDFKATSEHIYSLLGKSVDILPFNSSVHSAVEIIAGHPILVYRMLRRLKALLRETTKDGAVFPAELQDELSLLESSEDNFNNSMRSIYHLQDVYNVKPNQMALGELVGYKVTGDIPLLEFDHVMQIATFGIDHALFILAFDWLSLAQEMAGNCAVRKSHVQNAISHCIEKHNEMWFEVASGDKLLPPGSNLFIYTEPVEDASDISRLDTMKQFLYGTEKGKASNEGSWISYYAVCNGENLQTVSMRNSLRCYYERKMRPELAFYPVKVEELSVAPSLIKIHDFIGGQLIRRLKELSFGREYMANYFVDKHVTNGSISLDYAFIKYQFRQTLSAWVKPSVDRKLQLLNRRLESITGLNYWDKESSERYEVIAYTPGSSFYVHHDVIGIPKHKQRGERVNTMLIYLDGPILGGYTAFPLIGVAIAPEAGCALLWDNIHSDGMADLRTAHGSCPVVFGSKWGQAHPFT